MAGTFCAPETCLGSLAYSFSLSVGAAGQVHVLGLYVEGGPRTILVHGSLAGIWKSGSLWRQSEMILTQVLVVRSPNERLIYIYIYVCVCVRERERERVRAVYMTV